MLIPFQVLNNFKSGDLTYRVQSYDDFIKSKENNVVTSQNTGITPTLESVPFNLPPRQDSFGDSKKRPLSEEKVVTFFIESCYDFVHMTKTDQDTSAEANINSNITYFFVFQRIYL